MTTTPQLAPPTTAGSAPAVPPARKWGVLALACVAALVPNIDLTALHLAIPGLIRDLDPSGTQILWISDMYGFILAGLLITMGSLGDRFGRKRVMLLGMAGFAAASAMTAYAHSAGELIAARALLGVAGATIMPCGLALIRNVFTVPKERTMAIGITGGVGGLGVGLGPALGGLVLDHFWWGSVFLINVPIMVVLVIAGAIVLPESRNPAAGRVDLVSVVLSIAGVLGVVYAIKEAAVGSGTEPLTLAAGAAGVAALVAFGVRQTHIAHPLIDLKLFRLRAFSGSLGTNMVAMFALVAQSLVFAQYYQLVLGWSPLRAGLAGLPGAFAAMTGGALAAPLIARLGRARVAALGLAVSVVGFSMFTTVGTATPYSMMVAAMIPNALGFGLAMAVTMDTVLATVPRQRASSASAISETATELGAAVGMAVLGSVLNAVYRANIAIPAGVPAQARGAVHDSIGAAGDAARTMPAGLARQVTHAASDAYVQGMHTAVLVSAGLAAVAALYALVSLRGLPAELPSHDDE